MKKVLCLVIALVLLFSFCSCTDKDIPVTFSKYDLAGKAKCKEELQKELGLEVDPNAMVIGMVGRLVSHKGLDLVRAACDRILEMPVQIAVLGSGESAFESFFRYMQEKYPGKFPRPDRKSGNRFHKNKMDLEVFNICAEF